MRKSPYKKMTLGIVGLGLAMNPFTANAGWRTQDGGLSSDANQPGATQSQVAASDAQAAPASFLERNSWLTFGAKCAGGVAATAALTTFGVPIWLASPLAMHSPRLLQSVINGSLVKDTMTTFMTDGLSKGVQKATRLWAPQVLEGTTGKMAAAVLTPMASLLACKTAVDAGVSAVKTMYGYAKKNPLKAALGAGVASAAVYYGAPLIKEALVRLGDSTLSSTRAVIDHGSGAIKGSYVTYNPFNDQVVGEVVKFNTAGVSLSKTMAKGADGLLRLDDKTMKEGIDSIKAFVEQAKKAGVSEVNITGSATAWARSGAVNVQAYIDAVKEQTGVQLNVVTQVDEGQFGRIAAAAQGVDVANETVLDTGGGSLQLTKGSVVYGTETASATFGKHAEKVMGKPLSAMKWTKDAFKRLTEEARAKTLASNTAGTGDVLGQLRASIEKSGKQVKGIGNVYNGVMQFIKSLSSQTNTLTSADLDLAMSKLDGLSTDEVAALVERAGLDKRFAGNVAANLPLVSGIMKAFDIQSIDVVNADSGMGVYFYDPLWQDTATNKTIKAVQDVSNAVLGAKGSKRTTTKRR